MVRRRLRCLPYFMFMKGSGVLLQFLHLDLAMLLVLDSRFSIRYSLHISLELFDDQILLNTVATPLMTILKVNPPKVVLLVQKELILMCGKK